MLLGESRGESVEPVRRRGLLWRRSLGRIRTRVGSGVTVTRARIAIAVCAVVVTLRGVAPVTTAGTELWPVGGLLLAQVAVFLPLWRGWFRGRDREDAETRRWHEYLRTRVWRATSMLLVGAGIALFVNRLDTWHGHPGAAATAGATGLALLLAGLTPAVLEPVAWRFAPARWRRTERIDRLIGALRGSYTPLTGFDPDRGASGRPKPFFDQPGGEPRPRPARAVLRGSDGAVLDWTGDHLAVVDPGSFARTIVTPPSGLPQDKPDRTRWAAELVWFSGQDRFKPTWDPRAQPVVDLLILDDRGALIFRVNVQVGNGGRSDDVKAVAAVAAVAKAAGLPFAAYSLSYPPAVGFEIQKLLFPPGRAIL